MGAKTKETPHWVAVNIKGTEIKAAKKDDVDAINKEGFKSKNFIASVGASKDPLAGNYLIIEKDKINEEWEKKGFKSEIVDKAPMNLLEIKYKEDIELGTKLKSTDAKTEPTVKFSQAKDNNLYTLVMVDFDLAKTKETPHWVAVNIKGTDIKAGKIPDANNVKLEYEAPDTTAGEKTVVFHVYEQAAKKDDVDAINKEGSKSKNFIASVGASKDPLAGNYLIIEKDKINE